MFGHITKVLHPVLKLVTWKNLLVLTDKVREVETCFFKSLSSLIKLPPQPSCWNNLAFFSASSALAFQHAFLAFSAATLVSFANLQYSAMAAECWSLSEESVFRRCNHASFFFLDGFLTSSVIQSASFSLGKDGELPLASRTATHQQHQLDWDLDHYVWSGVCRN